MKRTKIMSVLVAIGGAILSAIVLVLLTPNSSFLEFLGWVVFFIAIQAPFFISTKTGYYGCGKWFSKRKQA
jgi:inner membrane protein involved in colicin E2 resistance